MHRSLALIVILCLGTKAGAQGPTCVDLGSVPATIARGFIVNPLAAFASGDAVTVLGWPAYRTERDASGQHVAVDSLLAGVTVRSGGPPRTVPLPLPGRGFEEPYVLDVSGDSAHVLFLVPHERAVGAERPDSLEIWTGVVVGTRWSDLRHVTSVGTDLLLGTQIVSGAMSDSGTVTFAFGTRESDGGIAGITLLERRAKVWHRSVDRTAMRLLSYYDVARIGGRWWRAMIGVSRADEAIGDTIVESSLYVSELQGDAWSPPRRLVDGTGHQIGEPRLLSGEDGAWVAWMAFADPGRILHWLPLDRSAGAIGGSRPVVGRLTAGTGVWRDVLGFAPTEDIGVLATPSRGGWTERARLPISNGIPPVVFSGPDGPVAVVLSPAADDPDVEVIQFFDLRCALGPSRAPK